MKFSPPLLAAAVATTSASAFSLPPATRFGVPTTTSSTKLFEKLPNYDFDLSDDGGASKKKAVTPKPRQPLLTNEQRQLAATERKEAGEKLLLEAAERNKLRREEVDLQRRGLATPPKSKTRPTQTTYKTHRGAPSNNNSNGESSPVTKTAAAAGVLGALGSTVAGRNALGAREKKLEDDRRRIEAELLAVEKESKQVKDLQATVSGGFGVVFGSAFLLFSTFAAGDKWGDKVAVPGGGGTTGKSEVSKSVKVVVKKDPPVTAPKKAFSNPFEKKPSANPESVKKVEPVKKEEPVKKVEPTKPAEPVTKLDATSVPSSEKSVIKVVIENDGTIGAVKVEAVPAEVKVAPPAKVEAAAEKPVEVKPVELKPVEAKSVEVKPVEVIPASKVEAAPAKVEAKPVEVKPVEVKPSPKVEAPTEKPDAASVTKAPETKPTETPPTPIVVQTPAPKVEATAAPTKSAETELPPIVDNTLEATPTSSTSTPSLSTPLSEQAASSKVADAFSKVAVAPSAVPKELPPVVDNTDTKSTAADVVVDESKSTTVEAEKKDGGAVKVDEIKVMINDEPAVF